MNATNANDIAARYARVTAALKQAAPLVHNITNLVVQNDAADAIAAVGGVQMTLHAPAEAAEIAAVADALTVNVGTPDPAWLEAADTAVRTVMGRGRPWVLDPVAVGFSDYRTEAIHKLLAQGPTVIKSNASETLALARTGTSGRAGDSRHAVDDAIDAARRIARQYGCVVAVTGERDLITDGARTVRLHNGHPMMGRMIGSGCMLSSVLACFLAVADDPFEAALAGLVHFAVAGELAAARAGGPGTLKPLLIDALYNLDAVDVSARLKVSELTP
ncbi:hydroxyethylthiazole kinase [Salinisphaera sp. RV14]|uniref:hydroxyethylthiazole kinase n=1 Tax=unclassified Salinisphaera TaxID=2649847 RepID=UPI003F856EB7